MRLFALTALTMLAFAGNSILNRLALADVSIAPDAFALIRLFSGALVLAVLVVATRPHGVCSTSTPRAVHCILECTGDGTLAL